MWIFFQGTKAVIENCKGIWGERGGGEWPIMGTVSSEEYKRNSMLAWGVVVMAGRLIGPCKDIVNYCGRGIIRRF